MRPFRFQLVWLVLFCVTALCGQQPGRAPLVRSWTIREVGSFKKIPTATLRAKMAQRGVLFGVNEPYSQDKVDGTTLLLRQIYKDAGVPVLVRSTTIPLGPGAVKVEYVVNRQ
jgi:hypothetical protein